MVGITRVFRNEFGNVWCIEGIGKFVYTVGVTRVLKALYGHGWCLESFGTVGVTSVFGNVPCNVWYESSKTLGASQDFIV